ncbi:MAG TPA: iron-siderophore ABC transporter substrate-binding protein [Chloroflexota bacterium]
MIDRPGAFRSVLLAPVLLALAAACAPFAASGPTPSSPTAGAPPASVATSPPAAGAMSAPAADRAAAAASATPTVETAPSPFPVTVEHKFGRTTVPSAPQRVVSLGYTEQDPILALGVKPIAVREWFGKQPHAVWPWAQDELGDARPVVLTMPFGQLNFETIAALRPDLIVATHAGINEEEYRTLSRIAPTVAQPGEYPDFGVPWQEQTRIVGRALGRAERAEQIVAEVEARIAAARQQHPEFQGATVAWASPADGQGQYWVVGPRTPPMRFLAALGFRVPDDLANLVGERDSVPISAERLSLLDVDVLVFQVDSAEERAAVESNPLYRQLRVAREGRTIFFVGLQDPLYGALSFSTVLSLPFAVDRLVPMLAAAVDGDPDTPARP